MKYVAALLASLLLAFPAFGQIPGGGGIAINQTPITGGTSGLCLYQTTAGKVGEQACGTGTAADIKVGTTTVSSGTTTRVLYDNAGVLGEYSLTGAWLPLAGLATQATNTIVGNATSGTASPTALAIGSCSAASSALTWTTNTGFGCNTLGSGTVTSVSVTTANGVSGVVATATTTPAITLTLGAITPSTVTIGAGSAITSSGAGGALGANAFTSTAYATLTTNTFTGLQTLTPSAANQGLIASTGGSNTGSDTTSAVNLAWTLNTSGAADVFKIATTVTSGANANLVNIYGGASGTTSQFKIKSNGGVQVGPGSIANVTAAWLAAGIFLADAGTGNAVAAIGYQTASSFNLTSGGRLSWSDNASTLIGSSEQTIIASPAAANIRFGGAPVDTGPVAQTLSMQNTLAGGTSNVAGALFILQGSLGKGSVGGGSLGFNVGVAGASGTVVNTSTRVLTLDNALLATFAGQIAVTSMTQTSAAQSGTMCYNTSGGAINYDATLGCLTSSGMFKRDISTLGGYDALDMTMALRPVSFRRKVEFGGDVDPAYQVGFVAEEVANIDERLIGRGPDGKVRGVRYQQLTAVLAGAIQVLKSEVDELKRTAK